jgi:hypothetical protein
MEKVGTTCYFIFKEGGIGKYDSISCSNLEWSGGGTTTLNAQRIYTSTFEVNEISNLDTNYDEDAGFIYLTYGETLDKYPVIAVRNASSFSSLDKDRISEDTTENNKVYTLSSNNLMNVYTINGIPYLKTYTTGLDGLLTNIYTIFLLEIIEDNDLIYMPTTTTNFLFSYEYDDNLALRTLGVGLIPPPGPEKTSVTIKDESTLGNLDFTDLTLKFTAMCTNNTEYETTLTSTLTSVPVDCDYTGFSMRVEYEDVYNDTYSYTRYYLRDLDDTYGQFDLDVYLVNPYTTDFVTTHVIVDDLRSKYTNAEVSFIKNINGDDTQITAFDLDLTNKMNAVLMTDDIYYVYIDSDETSSQFLGKFVTAEAGTTTDTKVFYLYDIDTTFNYDSLEKNFQYTVYVDNYTIEGIAKKYEGATDTLMNISLTLYNGSNTASDVINTYTAGSSATDPLYSFLSTGELDYASYENTSVFAEFTVYYYVNGEELHNTGTRQLWLGDQKVNLPLMGYVDQGFMDWFFLILFSVIALFATIQTANIASIGLILLASLFVIFGWFSVGTGTLAIAALVALISFIAKKGDA